MARLMWVYLALPRSSFCYIFSLQAISFPVVAYFPDFQILLLAEPSFELYIYVVKCSWKSISNFTYSNPMISSLQLTNPSNPLQPHQIGPFLVFLLSIHGTAIYPESYDHPWHLLVLLPIHHQVSILILNTLKSIHLFISNVDITVQASNINELLQQPNCSS